MALGGSIFGTSGMMAGAGAGAGGGGRAGWRRWRLNFYDRRGFGFQADRLHNDFLLLFGLRGFDRPMFTHCQKDDMHDNDYKRSPEQ